MNVRTLIALVVGAALVLWWISCDKRGRND